MTSTLPPLVQALSGALGSATSNTLTYPLDLISTRVQLAPKPESKSESKTRGTGIVGAFRVLRHVLRQYGADALYDGIVTDTGATLVSNFFYFYFYSFLRSLLTRRRSPSSPPLSAKASSIRLYNPSVLEELLLGFIAGVASRALSTPLNIVTVRLQTEREEDASDDAAAAGNDVEKTADPAASVKTGDKGGGIVSAVKHIYEEHGLGGFWRGFKTTTLLSLNPSLTLALFQVFRRALLMTRPSPVTAKGIAVVDPKPAEAFLGAAIANSIAVALLYPLILAKTRLQSQSPTSPFRRLDSLTAVLVDAQNSGTLYQGLEMQIMKGFLSQGVTFLVKGRIEEAIVRAYLRRKRSVA